MNEIALQIIGALSAGAIAAGTDVASDAVKSAYGALKSAVRSLIGEKAEEADKVEEGTNAKQVVELEKALAGVKNETVVELSEKCDLLKLEISKVSRLVEIMKAKSEELKSGGVTNVMMREGSKFIYDVVELHDQAEVNITGEKDSVFKGRHFKVESKK